MLSLKQSHTSYSIPHYVYSEVPPHECELGPLYPLQPQLSATWHQPERPSAAALDIGGNGLKLVVC
jgi:hypothetical protein